MGFKDEFPLLQNFSRAPMFYRYLQHFVSIETTSLFLNIKQKLRLRLGPYNQCENNNFQVKNCDIFLTFPQNIDPGSNEYPRSVF